MDSPKLPFKHRYFETYPVENEQTASFFSKKITFSVIELLWKAGPNGLTHKEVYEYLTREERLDIGRTIVYQTLKGLYDNELVRREWDNKVKAHRNVLGEMFRPAALEEDFEDWAYENLRVRIETTLFPVFRDYLNKVLTLAREKEIPNDFIPKQGKEGWCHFCDRSHEADFFFLALLYHAAYSFVYSPVEWKFRDKAERDAIVKLYTDNKLADPKGLAKP
jgi:predicted transcriptional regulator